VASRVPAVAEVLDQIAKVAAEHGRPGPLDPDAQLQRDWALDSVALLTLAVSLEDRFEVILREEDTAAVHTARELAALVVRRAGETP
jgi:acyl carrier protein